MEKHPPRDFTSVVPQGYVPRPFLLTFYIFSFCHYDSYLILCHMTHISYMMRYDRENVMSRLTISQDFDSQLYILFSASELNIILVH